MRIFVGHSTEIDYKYNLYKPLEESELATQHEFVFAHAGWSSAANKSTITGCDAMLAEVSKPSLDVGIEIGWANSARIPIICLYVSGSRPSDSLRHIAFKMIEYYNKEEMLEGITSVLSRL